MAFGHTCCEYRCRTALPLVSQRLPADPNKWCDPNSTSELLGTNVDFGRTLAGYNDEFSVPGYNYTSRDGRSRWWFPLGTPISMMVQECKPPLCTIAESPPSPHPGMFPICGPRPAIQGCGQQSRHAGARTRAGATIGVWTSATTGLGMAATTRVTRMCA